MGSDDVCYNDHPNVEFNKSEIGTGLSEIMASRAALKVQAVPSETVMTIKTIIRVGK
jgi:hypothetical protein